eukprot:Protomagalhaensia_sp_Gyna_25__4494@NODE_412_length_3518_cov_432_119862_g318_i0_p4_GENE_NODE_412_length_3518_cov_432_119862_g318_i0NODE_412_length_3518_cov_432_119862_g318_i0_p4_ORF_typecomplete_len216_score22_35AgrD/PF05931_11/0_63AgrD/PF05931_11/2_2e03PSI/PF01437_25/3_5PSI/PF01437_25/6_6e03PSI/PF01437_25/0_099_NODE_412_length_3518_cov_432_119862_g318_i09071554
MRFSVPILLPLAGVVTAQRFEDNCHLKDRISCLLSTSGVYVEADPCSGWCDESRQCMGRGATICPLEEMTEEDHGFIALRHLSALQCTAIAHWGKSGVGYTQISTVQGWCLPNTANGNLDLGHCSERPLTCNTATCTLYSSPAEVPCQHRHACFDCLAKSSDPNDLTDCVWCPETSICEDSQSSTCGTANVLVESTRCSNANRHRDRVLAIKSTK